MSRYFKFVWAGMFLCPASIYWVMLGLVIIIFAIGLITNRMVDDPYREAEQQYKITVILLKTVNQYRIKYFIRTSKPTNAQKFRLKM